MHTQVHVYIHTCEVHVFAHVYVGGQVHMFVCRDAFFCLFYL